MTTSRIDYSNSLLCGLLDNSLNKLQRVQNAALLLLLLLLLLLNEDMILALAGQFKQLSHEPEKFR